MNEGAAGMVVYKIENTLNGKIYIGITRDLSKRIYCHLFRTRTGWQSLLYNAIRKYGWDAFTCEVIDSSAQSWSALQQLEMAYIEQYQSYFKDKKGYNMTLGGEGALGWVPSAQWRANVSARTKNQVYSPEHRAATSLRTRGELNPNYGKTHSPEVRQKISEGIRKANEEGRGAAGKPWSDVQRAKQSSTLKNICRTEGRASTRWIEWDGRTQPMVAWCEELGIPQDTLKRRLDVLGWSVERALSTSVRLVAAKGHGRATLRRKKRVEERAMGIDRPNHCVGADVGGSKLNDDAVREIRKLRAKGMSLRGIGELHGVKESTVCNITLRKTWKHVEDLPVQVLPISNLYV